MRLFCLHCAQSDYKEASRADRILRADRAEDGQSVRTNDEHLSSDSEGTTVLFVIGVLDSKARSTILRQELPYAWSTCDNYHILL